METEPTEISYAAELKSIIDSLGLGFRAEIEKRIEGEKLRVDLLIYQGNALLLIVEVKRPEAFPSLSDDKLIKQAKEYANLLIKKHTGLRYFATHNLKHLMLFEWRKIEKKRLQDFEKPSHDWFVVRPLPWSILPSASQLSDYESNHLDVRSATRNFLMDFKARLEGKTLDVRPEIIQTLASSLEKIADGGGVWFFDLYKRDVSFQSSFDTWLRERGIKRPKNDDETRIQLKRLAMEQAYTLIIKLMFYHVLRLKYDILTSKLSDIKIDGSMSAAVMREMWESLFKDAIKESGDFQLVFETDLVDSLPIPSNTVGNHIRLFNYLREINWRNLDYDVIGTIFEDMIHEQRRHLLGQYFTKSEVVDLILAFTVKEVGPLLDPAVGSGTFLVRAYQRMRYLNPDISHSDLVKQLFGIDVDKTVAMLAAVNLYIRDPLSPAIANPNVSTMDFFSPQVKPSNVITSFVAHGTDVTYRFQLPASCMIVANPPYTRQEEMESAFYTDEYKKKIISDTITPIRLVDNRSLDEKWSLQSSIYSYFLAKSTQFLDSNRRLGYITSNSWLDAAFGSALKEYFLGQFRIIAIVGSSVERWFEDADINTTILILEKPDEKERQNLKSHEVKFVTLKAPIKNLLGTPSSGFDITEMRNYWQRLDKLISEMETTQAKEHAKYNDKAIGFAIDDERMRLISVRQPELRQDEKWGIFLRASKVWFEVLGSNRAWFKTMKDQSGLYELRRGFTTNANELYYLPSKTWKLHKEVENRRQVLSQTQGILSLSKKSIKPIVKSPTQLERYSIHEEGLDSRIIYFQTGKDKVKDDQLLRYIKWMETEVAREYVTNGRFYSVARKLFAPELKNRMVGASDTKEEETLKNIAKDFLDSKRIEAAPDWYVLPKRDPAQFLCNNGINKRFAFVLNDSGAIEDERLYGLKVDTSEVPLEVYFAVLNCTLTYMAIELWGRTQLGLGVLDVKVDDYLSMPILDVKKVWNKLKKNMSLKKRLQDIVEKMKMMKVMPIGKEIEQETRRDLDELILVSILGLPNTKAEIVRQELKGIVENRLSRARTISR
jgi:type I restriction-modification system DNA methylase subunit